MTALTMTAPPVRALAATLRRKPTAAELVAFQKRYTELLRLALSEAKGAA